MRTLKLSEKFPKGESPIRKNLLGHSESIKTARHSCLPKIEIQLHQDTDFMPSVVTNEENIATLWDVAFYGGEPIVLAYDNRVPKKKRAELSGNTLVSL